MVLTIPTHPKLCPSCCGLGGHPLPPQSSPSPPCPGTYYMERGKGQVSEEMREGGTSQDSGLSHRLPPVASSGQAWRTHREVAQRQRARHPSARPEEPPCAQAAPGSKLPFPLKRRGKACLQAPKRDQAQ